MVDRFTLFTEGGAGAAMISSSVLGKVMITDPGEQLSIAFQASVGIEYHLENCHYTVGLASVETARPHVGPARVGAGGSRGTTMPRGARQSLP